MRNFVVTRPPRRASRAVAALALLFCAPALWPQSDLAEASLDQLVNMKVTSVSKKEQKLFRAAAAVFVLTQEDIRRSGATSIPDLLRLVPGVQVAQIDSNTWAISIRGFNARYTNKVLVLVDGRSVYSPSFAGVFWDHQDMPLEDIERIEVIRGPGATVWGANAVNGVINIITKSSKVTNGGLLAATAGSDGRGEPNTSSMVRYGGRAGTAGTYRVFGKALSVDNLPLLAGGEAADGWHRFQVGFRSDCDLSSKNALTVEGSAFDNQEGETRWHELIPQPGDQPFNQRFAARGGNLLGRWTHTLDDGSETSLQMYYDSYRRYELGIPESQDSFDADFQHHVPVGSRHDLVWGLGARFTRSAVKPGYGSEFAPPSITQGLYSSFVQDQIRVAKSLWFTVGSKFEHNDYTGFEYEPGASLTWTPGRRHTLWASAARAIRQPSVQDNYIHANLSQYSGPNNIPITVALTGNPHSRTEELHDFEIGYRAQFNRKLSLDIDGFDSFYRHLQTVSQQDPVLSFSSRGPSLLIPLRYTNQAHAHDLGGEASINWSVTPRLRISPGYAFLQMRLGLDTSDPLTQYSLGPGMSPNHMFQVRSLWNLSRNVDLDNTLYYTGRLPFANVPSYFRLDSRLAWRFSESAEFSVVGQNLLRPQHQEFGSAYAVASTLAERSVYGKITWRF